MPTSLTEQGSGSSDSRSVALARSRRLSQALKQAAGQVGGREVASPALLRSRLTWFVEPRQHPFAALYRFRIPYRTSFVAVSLIPSLIAIIYFAFIASGQYASEMKFSVRTGESTTPSLTQGQDTMILANYLHSRALVEELDQRVGLRAMFSRSDIDWWSRFDRDAPIEMLVRFWGQKAASSIENASGIVTLRVRAFSPEDSHSLAKAVLDSSEALVNRMQARSRQDLVAHSEAELQRAELRLKNSRITQQDLRNEEGMLDPMMQAEGINKLLAGLRLDRIRAEGELATTQPSLSEQSPQVQILRARLRAIDEQIAGLEGKLTGGSGEGGPTLAQSISRFDEVEMEHKVAQAQYVSAASALERARVSAERQSIYLSAFVQPVLPEEARYPRRFWAAFGFAAGSFLLWAAGIGIATLVRDHMA